MHDKQQRIENLLLVGPTGAGALYGTRVKT